MTLTEVCSDLFLFLVTFRRQVRKGMNPEISQVRQQLLDIFAEQDRLVQDDANVSRLYERVKYILVVLADEILINSNWAYSSAWEESLLEWEFFKTRVAGEEFFERLEREGETDEKLAEIYYLALSLGFVGKFNDNPTKISDLKRRLYRMLPGRFSDQDTKITPDAYYVAEGVKDIYRPLMNLGLITIVCAVLFLGLWVLYFVYRGDVMKDIRLLAKEMKAHAPPDHAIAATAPALPDEPASDDEEDSRRRRRGGARTDAVEEAPREATGKEPQQLTEPTPEPKPTDEPAEEPSESPRRRRSRSVEPQEEATPEPTPEPEDESPRRRRRR
jgi:type IV/VI secretion system ImpK/VasF family protein